MDFKQANTISIEQKDVDGFQPGQYCNLYPSGAASFSDRTILKALSKRMLMDFKQANTVSIEQKDVDGFQPGQYCKHHASGTTFFSVRAIL